LAEMCQHFPMPMELAATSEFYSTCIQVILLAWLILGVETRALRGFRKLTGYLGFRGRLYDLRGPRCVVSQ